MKSFHINSSSTYEVEDYSKAFNYLAKYINLDNENYIKKFYKAYGKSDIKIDNRSYSKIKFNKLDTFIKNLDVNLIYQFKQNNFILDIKRESNFKIDINKNLNTKTKTIKTNNYKKYYFKDLYFYIK